MAKAASSGFEKQAVLRGHCCDQALHIESDGFCHGSLHSNPVELIEEFAPDDSQALLRDQRENRRAGWPPRR